MYFASAGGQHDLDTGDTHVYCEPIDDIMLGVLVWTSHGDCAPGGLRTCRRSPLANSIAADRATRRRAAKHEICSFGGHGALQEQGLVFLGTRLGSEQGQGLEAFLHGPHRARCESFWA